MAGIVFAASMHLADRSSHKVVTKMLPMKSISAIYGRHTPACRKRSPKGDLFLIFYDWRKVRRQATRRIRWERDCSSRYKSRLFPRPPGFRPHRRDHGIVGLALSRDAVVVLGGEELQQPFFGHLIGVLVRERL